VWDRAVGSVWRACAQASQLRSGKRSRSGTFTVRTPEKRRVMVRSSASSESSERGTSSIETCVMRWPG
jgi:hypothetical protein